MATSTLADDLTRVEGLVRAGELRRARAELRRLTARRPPTPLLARAANLCRRAGAPLRSLELLAGRVRARHAHATPNEILEYAAALSQAGGVAEARKLLLSIEAPAQPLMLAFTWIREWNYAEAIPLLKKYLRESSLDPYAQLVGQMNLVAALIGNREGPEAARGLADIEAATQAPERLRLRGNWLELRAQWCIDHRRYAEAHDILEAAERILSEAPDADRLWVKKWKAILGLAEGRPDSLTLLRAHAADARAFEVLRDLDRQEARWRRKESLGLRVLYGTPFPAFRDDLLREWQWKVPSPERLFPWTFGGEPSSARVFAARDALGGDDVVNRLFWALTRDFYRPPTLLALHSEVFAEDHYNPNSSPNRMHQILRRLRDRLRARRAPLVVRESEGTYRLAARTGHGVRIDVPFERIHARQDAALVRIQAHFGARPFSTQEFAAGTAKPYRTAHRRLQEMVAVGTVKREGRGPRTRYRFVSAAPT